MYDPAWGQGASEDDLAFAVSLLEAEPTEAERDLVAALDAAELAEWNAPDIPGVLAEVRAAVEDAAGRAQVAEALTRKAQAVMLREVHALTARVVAEDAAYAGGIRHEAGEFAADEVAAALGVPRHVAWQRIEDADALVGCCPRTLACLEAGLVSYPAAVLLARETGYAPPGQAHLAETRILDRLAGTDLPGLGSMSVEQIARAAVLHPAACWRVAVAATPGRVRRLARRVLVELDAEVPTRRRTQPGPSDITAFPTRPGWMMLGLELTEADGCTAQARIHADARSLKNQPGETRTMGQLRVQAFHDLLLGHTPPDQPGNDDGPDDGPGPGGPDRGPSPYDGLVTKDPGRPVGAPRPMPVPVPFDVHLTIDATGQVAAPRHGLLDPGALEDIISAATAAGGRVRVHPITPKPCPGTHPDPKQLAADPDPRFPDRALAASIRMRDQVCRFPGCTIPAGRTDLDHTIPWPHGPTCPCNLCCLCRHHHRLKTHGRWTVINHGNGRLTWTTPTGRTLHSNPDP